MLSDSSCSSPQQQNQTSQEPPRLQTNSGRYLRLGGLLVLGGFVGSLIWAGLAPLDKGIAVMGHIVVAENRKLVQSLQGGRVQQLHIAEGR